MYLTIKVPLAPLWEVHTTDQPPILERLNLQRRVEELLGHVPNDFEQGNQFTMDTAIGVISITKDGS